MQDSNNLPKNSENNLAQKPTIIGLDGKVLNGASLYLHDAKRKEPSDYIPDNLIVGKQNSSIEEDILTYDLYDLLYSEDESLRQPVVDKDSLSYKVTLPVSYRGYVVRCLIASHENLGMIYSPYAKKESDDSAPDFLEATPERTEHSAMRNMYKIIDAVRKRNYVSIPRIAGVEYGFF